MDIPAIESAQGTVSRVVTLRMKPGTDLLLGLQETCEKYGIRNGVILSCIGSLDGVYFCNPIEQPEKKAGYGYGDPLHLSGPIEMTCAAGVVCHDEAGSTNLHVHITLTDREGHAYGGHLLEGAKVLLNVDAVIGEISGMEMLRALDPELEVPRLSPRQA